MLQVRKAKLEDVTNLAYKVKDVDVEECMAMCGRGIEYGLGVSYLNSKRAWTVFKIERFHGDQGTPVAMLGVTPSEDEEVGIPWAVTTNLHHEDIIQFLRGSDTYLEEMYDIYPTLQNVVSVKNKPALLWLRWLGFKVFTGQVLDAPHGNLGFYLFRGTR